MIRDDAVQITTVEAASRWRYARTYAVDDLPWVKEHPEAACRSLAEAIRIMLSAHEASKDAKRPAPGKSEAVVSAVPANAPRSLVVRHHHRNQERVADLLAAFRIVKADDEAQRAGIPCGNVRAEKKLLATLNATTQLDFIETPLSDILNYLKEVHQVEIQLDRKGLDDGSITTDKALTKKMTSVSLHVGLRTLLRDAGLTYTMADEVLLITTPERAKENLITRVYPLPQGTKKAEAMRLATAIPKRAGAGSWQADAGSKGHAAISAVYLAVPVLVITQTPEIHREIAALLTRPEAK